MYQQFSITVFIFAEIKIQFYFKVKGFIGFMFRFFHVFYEH